MTKMNAQYKRKYSKHNAHICAKNIQNYVRSFNDR